MTTEHSPTRRILVVDDDERVARVISDGLSDLAGFEVVTQTSSPHACTVLQEAPVDLLITDWRMPEIDGLELIRHARERAPHMPAVLMTAYGSADVASAVEQSAIQHYLEKPFEIDDLIHVVKTVFPDPTPPPKRVRPQVIKVILGGDANVGKTTLINRFCTGRFEPVRRMTIGVDFHSVDLDVQGNATRLMVWDLGGQGRFGAARRGFYRGSMAVGLVYDTGNRTSFYNLMRWWREVREHLADVPMILLANKCDLPQQVSHDQALALASAWGIPFMQASCATGAGVAEFFQELASTAWQNVNVRPVKRG